MIRQEQVSKKREVSEVRKGTLSLKIVGHVPLHLTLTEQ